MRRSCFDDAMDGIVVGYLGYVDICEPCRLCVLMGQEMAMGGRASRDVSLTTHTKTLGLQKKSLKMAKKGVEKCSGRYLTAANCHRAGIRRRWAIVKKRWLCQRLHFR